jgi:hypothetical protein
MPISRSLTKYPTETSNKRSLSRSIATQPEILNRSAMQSIETEINDPKYSIATGAIIFTFVLGLIVNVFILNWLVKIGKCQCAKLPEKKFITEWFMFRIIWVIICLAYFIATEGNNKDNVFVFLSTLITIIDVVMIIRLFIYIRKLKERKCDCGLSQSQNLIYYYLIVIFSILLFAIIISIIGAILALSS